MDEIYSDQNKNSANFDAPVPLESRKKKRASVLASPEQEAVIREGWERGLKDREIHQRLIDAGLCPHTVSWVKQVRQQRLKLKHDGRPGALKEAEIEIIRRLYAAKKTDREIAESLTAQGFRRTFRGIQAHRLKLGLINPVFKYRMKITFTDADREPDYAGMDARFCAAMRRAPECPR